MIVATNNLHKLEEIRAILGNSITLQSLADIGCTDDIPETADTFQGNALMKARYIYERYGEDCFADDSGLEVEALNGEPGVHSARYAGDGHNSVANTNKLLSNMEGITDRRARFRTVIALIIKGKEYFFEGIVEGEITYAPEGEKGFGYDPVFRPVGFSETFAQLPAEVKNSISHRARALEKLVQKLLTP